jgi:hypothetical protein
MKKIILCITALLLLFTSCEKIPKNVKPIDWYNHNDVYTLYWNCRSTCKENKRKNEGKAIKISGWKTSWSDSFLLCDDIVYKGSHPFPFIPIQCYLPEFKTKMDTCDFTKTCYIKGIIHLELWRERPRGCIIEPYIEITNIDDIYFK